MPDTCRMDQSETSPLSFVVKLWPRRRVGSEPPSIVQGRITRIRRTQDEEDESQGFREVPEIVPLIERWLSKSV
jgi:hypothetical protein